MTSFADWLKEALNFLQLSIPPLAFFFLILVSLAVTLISLLLTRLLVNPKDLKNAEKQILTHSKNKELVLKERDTRAWVKVIHNQARIQEIQQSITFRKIVPQILLLGVFWLIFSFLRDAMGNLALNKTPDRGGVVAVLPFEIPDWLFPLSLFFSKLHVDPGISVAGFGIVYILSAIASSLLLSQIFGVNPRISDPIKI